MFGKDWSDLHKGWAVSMNAAAYRSHLLTEFTHMGLDDLNALLEWKLDRAVRNTKEGKMEDTITIEMKVDFGSKDVMPQLIGIACSMARTLKANVDLLGPVTKAQCVVFTDSHFAPPQKIDIYADLIGKGQEELNRIAARDDVYAPSAEMLDMLRDKKE